MNSLLPQELSEKFSRIILLRSGETLVGVLNTSRIRIEALLKDINQGTEWLDAPWPADLLIAFSDGIKKGAFVLTNERLVFARRRREREGLAVWTSHHYETEVSVDLKELISVNVKENILEIIYREGTETGVLHFSGFHEMDPKQPGYESIRKTVNPSEIAHIIDERRGLLT